MLTARLDVRFILVGIPYVEEYPVLRSTAILSNVYSISTSDKIKFEICLRIMVLKSIGSYLMYACEISFLTDENVSNPIDSLMRYVVTKLQMILLI